MTIPSRMVEARKRSLTDLPFQVCFLTFAIATPRMFIRRLHVLTRIKFFYLNFSIKSFTVICSQHAGPTL